MVATDPGAPPVVDGGADRVPHGDHTVADPGVMAVQARGDQGRVGDLGPPVGADDDARVADLAAGLGVERCPVEHQHRPGLAGLDHGEHGGVVDPVLISAEELGGPVPGQERGELLTVGIGDGIVAGRLGPLSLGRHLGVEPVGVDADAALASDLLGDLQRKAIGVVEPEGHRPAEPALTGRFELGVEDVRAGAEGFAEANLLALGDLAHDRLVLDQAGIIGAHDLDHRLDDRRRDDVGHPEEVGVTDGPTHDAAQDVPAVLVGRVDAVADEKGAGSSVVGQDAERDVLLGARTRLDAGGGRRGPEELDELGGLPHRIDPLQHRHDALEPGPGVDGRPGKRRLGPVGGLIELHEDQVPELEESLAGRVTQGATVVAELGTPVVVDLGTRAIGAGVGHPPPVVLVAQALDPFARDPDPVPPDVGPLVVGVVHRGPEAACVEPEDLGAELPRPDAGVFLEVVAEAEVAHHLEEGQMARGATHLFEVVVLPAGPHTLLDADRPGPRCGLGPLEVRLELDHARIDEQEAVVVGDQIGRRHRGVSALDEEVGEGAAKLVGVHEGSSLPGARGEPFAHSGIEPAGR